MKGMKIMKSYWIESIEKSRKKFQSLEDNEKADVCIIGGGITGLSTAYYLSKTNMKVILLEKDELCNQTTRKFYSKNN